MPGFTDCFNVLIVDFEQENPANTSSETCHKKLKPTQLTFNCLDSAIETLEKGAKYVQS